MTTVFLRVMLYVMAMTLFWTLGAVNRRMFFEALYLSGLFALLAASAFIKAIGFYDLSVWIFDYVMTFYLIGLVIVLVRSVWRTGNLSP